MTRTITLAMIIALSIVRCGSKPGDAASDSPASRRHDASVSAQSEADAHTSGCSNGSPDADAPQDAQAVPPADASIAWDASTSAPDATPPPPSPDASAPDALAPDASNPPPPPNGNSWYVSATGSASGDGSIANPWDIDTALAQPSTVHPGDTIWIRGGKYGGGQSNSVIYSHLVGTPTAPIVVRAYPGERAIIDAWLQVGCCDQAPNPAAGAYAWFWDLEFASYNPDRHSGTSGPPEWAAQQNHPAADTWAPGTKFIDNTVHDTSGGLSVWNPASDSELAGNIIFNVGGYGTDRGHGHDFYLQNAAPSVLNVTDNIGFNNFDIGIQAYGSGNAAYVQNIHIVGNVVFNSGVLQTGSNTANGTASAGPRTDNLLVGEGIDGPSGIVIDDNFFYHTPEADDGYNEIGYLWTPRAHDAVVTNNYFIGGRQAVDLFRWDSLRFQNNTVFAKYQTESYLIYRSDQSTAGYQDGQNTYYGSGQFLISSGCDSFPCASSSGASYASWVSETTLDQTSTYNSGAPTGVWTSVRPSAHAPGRANIVIYNWGLASSVAVDLSGAGISVGDAYQIRDGENWYGGAVVSGTYSGAPVMVPMTGLTVVPPNGTVPNPQPHTAPQFGVFVLLSGSALDVY
jgi:hypothetical protein